MRTSYAGLGVDDLIDEQAIHERSPATRSRPCRASGSARRCSRACRADWCVAWIRLKPLISVPSARTSTWLPMVCAKTPLSLKTERAGSHDTPPLVERANHASEW